MGCTVHIFATYILNFITELHEPPIVDFSGSKEWGYIPYKRKMRISSILEHEDRVLRLWLFADLVDSRRATSKTFGSAGNGNYNIEEHPLL
jgi:hypothetical protein